MARHHAPEYPALRAARITALILLLAALLFGYQAVTLYTDWLWFHELGQPGVFQTTFGARVTLFLGFGLLFFLVFFFNLWLAQRMSDSRPRPRPIDIERARMSLVARRLTRAVSLLAAVALSLLAGLAAAQQWPQYLQFTHPQAFGVTDPVFGIDIGFYVFRLPFLGFLVQWALALIGLSAIGVAVIYYSDGALDALANAPVTFAPHVRRHLLALGGVFALVYAGDYLLARYDLLYVDRDSYFGAGFADLHARLPAIGIQMAAMLLTAALFFTNIRYGRPFRLPLVGVALWLLVSLGAGAYAAFVQRFTVVPNQIGRETPYIARDIEFTRRAFGLDRVKESPFPSEGRLTAAIMEAERPTIDNIRLWDWPQLGLVYTAKQAVGTYYRFTLPPAVGGFNIDVDRYRLGREYRQVMLAPRELDTEELPSAAQTWQNQRLQYTHGYGVVASPVNRVDAEGLPEYFVSQIPVRSTHPELKIERPQIYYGELTNGYVFTGTRQAEFDYPAGAEIRETRYTGKGGVPLSSALVRTAWSIRLGDANMLLSGDFTPESRILFRRSIRQRLSSLAPFLVWDDDPYMVIHGGRLVWMADGYTLSDRYPYARPFGFGRRAATTRRFNYIRNSVKATVDAYDGAVRFYVADSGDPIIASWARIFPGLLHPMEEMPEGLKAHIRYPEDLFRIQRSLYRIYHMTEPAAFYRRDDAWEIPSDPSARSDQADGLLGPGPPMDPYYTIMRLPGDKEENFLLMTPFTPLNRPNMAAWMAARCDPDAYGELLVYRFPKDRPVNGPEQIFAQINAQADISSLRTLLNQQGSRLVFGNFLAIPVQSSLLYAVPLHVQSASAGIATTPAIIRVILATGDNIVMRRTLEEAVAALGSGEGAVAAEDTTPTAAASTPAGTATVPQLLNQASQAYQRARRLQSEYDRSLNELGRALESLQKALGRP